MYDVCQKENDFGFLMDLILHSVSSKLSLFGVKRSFFLSDI